ncbi:hypothetical protein CRUP_030300 [Coryphaenoides rupestris]|nr:hypothetical protein CRUP_030300 [Coryphaenoides rupestris]
MSELAVCRGSVGSIKALWETRILKNREAIQRPKSKDRAALALVQLSQVQEWQIHRTGLQKIPNFVSRFEHLVVLDLSRNAITQVPREIGEMKRLRELLLSFNKLNDIPEELGHCENLERLELAMNRHLSDLPSEFSQLKKLCHLDLSMNNFLSIPDSVRNEVENLPESLCLMQNLETLVLSSNRLTDIPALMEGMTKLRFVNFRDNPLTLNVDMLPLDKTPIEEEEEDREMFGCEFMHAYIQEARKRSAHTVLKVSIKGS